MEWITGRKTCARKEEDRRLVVVDHADLTSVATCNVAHAARALLLLLAFTSSGIFLVRVGLEGFLYVRRKEE